jgi:multiple sugar transport system permease protein
MYNGVYGVINDILFRLNLIHSGIPWLGDRILAKVAVVIANIWKGFPFSGLLYSAAWQTVPPELYEAAEIDGAGTVNKFGKITWPFLKPFMLTALVLATILTTNYFPLIYIMTGGGPGNATDTFVTYAYRVGFRFLKFNESATLSSFNFIFVLVISTFYIRLIFGQQKNSSI